MVRASDVNVHNAKLLRMSPFDVFGSTIRLFPISMDIQL